jgi:hypothetical protein
MAVNLGDGRRGAAPPAQRHRARRGRTLPLPAAAAAAGTSTTVGCSTTKLGVPLPGCERVRVSGRGAQSVKGASGVAQRRGCWRVEGSLFQPSSGAARKQRGLWKSSRGEAGRVRRPRAKRGPAAERTPCAAWLGTRSEAPRESNPPTRCVLGLVCAHGSHATRGCPRPAMRSAAPRAPLARATACRRRTHLQGRGCRSSACLNPAVSRPPRPGGPRSLGCLRSCQCGTLSGHGRLLRPGDACAGGRPRCRRRARPCRGAQGLSPEEGGPEPPAPPSRACHKSLKGKGKAAADR